MIYVALVGLTLIIVRGTIFRPIRRIWPALLECSQCSGAWVGMAAGSVGTIRLRPEVRERLIELLNKK